MPNFDRVTAFASSATITGNCGTTDCAEVTLATGTTLDITGTPRNKQRFRFEITPDSTPRALAFASGLIASGTVALPTTTVASTVIQILFIYTTSNSLNKWLCSGVA